MVGERGVLMLAQTNVNENYYLEANTHWCQRICSGYSKAFGPTFKPATILAKTNTLYFLHKDIYIYLHKYIYQEEQ